MINLEVYGKDLLQKELKACYTFFEESTNKKPYSKGYGLIRDKAPLSPEISSIASVGYGLASIITGINNDWLDYQEGYDRANKTLDTFLNNVENVEGFYHHFINMNDGRREWNCEVSIIDTGIFLCGAIAAGEFFGKEVKEKAEKLYKKINWQWYTDEKRNMFHMGYTKERGFSGHWDVYAEQLMLYILGVASPTHAIDRSMYDSFKKLKSLDPKYKDIIHSWFGSLFTHQFSHAWFDFKGKKDKDGIDWFQNSINATLANRQFCIDNSDKYKTFGENSWGLTACIGPNGYSGGYGSLPASDISGNDGTIAPCGAAGSIVFTPEYSIKALENYYHNVPGVWGKYGFKDGFNLEKGLWIANEYIGIDKGISLVMIENYLNNTIWNEFIKNEYVQKGLNKLEITSKENVNSIKNTSEIPINSQKKMYTYYKEVKTMAIDTRIKDVLNYYRSNPNCDSNMHEYVGLCVDLAQYLANCTESKESFYNEKDKYPTEWAVYEEFEVLSNHVSEKLLGNNLGITEDSPLYTLYREMRHAAQVHAVFGDVELRQMLAGISLYIAQERRGNPNFTFDNESELKRINELDSQLEDPLEVRPDGARKRLLEEIRAEFTKDQKMQEPEVSKRMTSILNYYSENPGCDPNIHEFIGLCSDMIAYLYSETPSFGIHAGQTVRDGKVVTITKEQRREQYPMACAVFDKFEILSNQVEEKLLSNNLGITENSPLYQLYKDEYGKVVTYSGYEGLELRQMLGGISLFIAQQKRDNPEFHYNNESELNIIQELADKHPMLLQTGSYRTKKENEEEWTVVPGQPTIVQHMLEEITTEFNRGQSTR